METREPPVFSPSFTLGLAAALLLPFAVKSVVYTEPWPAIVLPSGANEIAVTDGVASFTVTKVAVVAEDGKRQPIDARAIFEPVPPHYLFTLQAGGFGQDRRDYREVGVKRGGIAGVEVLRFPRSVPTDEQREAARAWLRSNARRAGLEGDRLSIRSQDVQVVMKTNQPTRS